MMDEGLLKIIGIALIGYGVIWCFFGYRFFRTLITITGFLIGAGIGYIIGVFTDEQSVAIALCLIGGAICAILVNVIYYVSIFLIGATMGVVVYQLLCLLAGEQLHFILAIIFLVAGGIIALKIVKLAIVLGTSFHGSSTIVAGAVLLFYSTVEIQRFFIVKEYHSQLILMGVIMIILGITGFLIQYKIAFGIPFKLANLNKHEKPFREKKNNHSHIDVTEDKDNSSSETPENKGFQFFCKNCGKKINSTANFCRYCGTKCAYR